MIEKLDFAAPFFAAEFVENEMVYPAKGRVLVLNLSRDESRPVRIEGIPLGALRSAVVTDARLAVPGRALVILDFGAFSVETEEAAEQVKSSWMSLWDYSHLERNRGVPYYKSPRAVVGGDTGMNFCLAEADSPSAIHREHGADFDEVHLQICGSGRVQLLRENASDTVYQELPLCPGAVNGPIWDEKGNYPWHRYHSTTRSVFVVVEIDRGGNV